MGIFKKILQKKEKGNEIPSLKKSTPKMKNAPPKGDPLAPSDYRIKEQTPPLPSSARNMMSDLTSEEERETSKSQEPASRNIIDPSLHPNKRFQEQRVTSDISLSETSNSPLGPVFRKVREAEQGLADMERVLVETAIIFKSAEALPRLKILFVEAKIKLAEAEIKISEAEIAPEGSPMSSGEIESRISMAEAKIGEAEKILTSVPSQGSGKGNLSRLKIAVAGMKIRLAEIQIALAGSPLEGVNGSVVAISEPVTSVVQPVLLNPTVPPDAEDIRMGVPNEAPDARQSDLPKNVKIQSVGHDIGVSLEAHSEPVRMKMGEGEGAWESRSGHSEQGERIILPDMEEDPSPFETGINMNRVRVRNGNADNTVDPQAVSGERVKIRSDERESAWVTEDGSLKIVSREKTGQEHPGDEEKPHISIQQPEVEKALVIEEQNRRGIEQRKKGDINGALESFERVLKIDPNNEAALHNKGVALRTAGRYEEALACFDRAQERDPDNPVILFNRGFCLGKLDRYEEALKAFDRVLALDPDHASGWFNKGKILQKMGRMEEAEEHLKKAQELGYH